MTERTSALIIAIAAVLLILALRYLEGLVSRARKKQNLDTPDWW